jgi:dTMP kinase
MDDLCEYDSHVMIEKRGCLIVFEGIDGSGKSTQAGILSQRLQKKNYKTTLLREPSDSKWGRKLREKALCDYSLTPEEELDLFHKDRKENVENNIKPAMAENRIVILDRYYFSTMAYQGAKGIDVNKIRRLNRSFAVPPDLVFILDIAPDIGLERIQNRKVKNPLFEREDYLKKVSRLFRSFRGSDIIHMDAELSEQNLADRIEKYVFGKLKADVSGK